MSWLSDGDILEVARILAEFNPDEARDKDGKWTDTDGNSPLSAALTVIKGANADRVKDIDSAVASIPKPIQEKVTGHLPGGFHAGPSAKVFKDKSHLGVDKGTLGFYDPNSSELRVSTSASGGNELRSTVVHEAMHVLDHLHGYSSKPNFFVLLSEAMKGFSARDRAQVSSHYDPKVEGRTVAQKEAWAELAAEYLEGRPFNLGPTSAKDKKAVISAETAANLEAYFKGLLGDRVVK
jgi:hypothetical protein